MLYRISERTAKAQVENRLKVFGASFITFINNGYSATVEFDLEGIKRTFSVSISQTSRRDNLCRLRDAIQGLIFLKRSGLQRSLHAAASQMLISVPANPTINDSRPTNLFSWFRQLVPAN